MAEEIDNTQQIEENGGSSQEESVQFHMFSAPRPLTEAEFDRIVILKYIENMTTKELQAVFSHEPTKEELLEMLSNGAKFPHTFLSAVEKTCTIFLRICKIPHWTANRK